MQRLAERIFAGPAGALLLENQRLKQALETERRQRQEAEARYARAATRNALAVWQPPEAGAAEMEVEQAADE
eukprot:1494806-Prymnesium_polylepis.1